MTYREQLAAREARAAETPRRAYLGNDEYRKLKGALTRARNMHDPQNLLRVVEHAVERFDATTWPDAWSDWRRALEDAGHEALRDAGETFDADECERLDDLGRELLAAAQILFAWA